MNRQEGIPHFLSSVYQVLYNTTMSGNKAEIDGKM